MVSANPSWYQLGLHLGLPYYQLESIEVHDRYRLHRGVAKMFQRWLITSPEPTWYALTEALRKVHMNAEADRIATLLTDKATYSSTAAEDNSSTY